MKVLLIHTDGYSMAILLKHDTEGFSVRGSRSDIACEIKK